MHFGEGIFTPFVEENLLLTQYGAVHPQSLQQETCRALLGSQHPKEAKA